MMHRHNVLRQPLGQNVSRDKSPREKMFHGTNEAHYLTCAAYYLIQKAQYKGMTSASITSQ